MIAFAFSLCVLYAPTDDLHRFPSALLADRYWSMSSAHLHYLDKHMPLYGSHHWQIMCSWKDESQFCFDCWDTLDSARKNHYRHWQDVYLHKLRDLLGDEAYFMGLMPPPVPYWRFQRIN